MRNKKAQVAETITWMVATIIIVIVLIISILISGVAFNKSSEKSENIKDGTDSVASKSLFSYLLTNNKDGKNIYSEINEEGKLNDFNGNLGIQIFKTYYENYDKEYSNVWLGIFEPAAGNKYFGTKPSVKANSGPDQAYTSPNVDLKIKIEGEKEIELLLIGR